MVDTREDKTVTITSECYRKYQTYELAFEDLRQWLQEQALFEPGYGGVLDKLYAIEKERANETGAKL